MRHMAVRFTWNADKAATNQRKHRVTFETAVQACLDRFAFSEQDRIEEGEYRWQTLGSTDADVVLLVAHTLDEDENGTEIVRIISARYATPRERRRYEEQRYGHL